MRRLLICLAALAPFAATPSAAADCGQFEAIEPGDSLSVIAARCDTTTDALFAANPGIDALDLQIGGVLRLAPDTAAAPSDARAMYAQIEGAYSPDGICFGRELQVDLLAERIFFGESACNIEDVQTVQGSLLILASQCNAEGEPQPDRTIQITQLEGGAIDYVGSSQIRLERCTDR